MPDQTPRKGSEVAAILGRLNRQQLTAMLIYLSGCVPSAFDEALSRFGGSEQ